MNYSNNWKEDLKTKGLPAENEFLKDYIEYQIEQNGTSKSDYKYKRCDNKDGDIYVLHLKELVNGKPLELLFEVKNDLKGDKTGNMSIEYMSRGKSSGIDVTKANYFVEKFKGTFYVIETESLRQAIKEKKYYRTNVRGGDLDTSISHLFKPEVIIDLIVDGMDKNNGSLIL